MRTEFFNRRPTSRTKMSAITGLDIIYGQYTEPKSGYYKIPVDLNKGCGGEYVYVCYSTTERRSPITNIQVFASDKRDFTLQSGYERIPCDLNKGAKGLYIYLCFTRSDAFQPVREVNVIQGPAREVYPPSVEWIKLCQDCSQGARGEYTFVTFRR